MRLCALLFSVLLSLSVQAADFRAQQLAVLRVKKAYEQSRAKVQQLFEAKGLAFPPRGIFLRVFKLDRQMELWGRGEDGRYVLVKQYPVCASSGDLGPKRQEGDGQVPEGFYTVSVFNPRSNYHLSLGIDYPNASDRARGQGKLGGAIMIHGDCVTIGCVPITDELIEEVYIAAVEARAAGQARIEAHFLPGRLDADGWKRLQAQPAVTKAMLDFWQELRPGFESFEQSRRVPVVRVDKQGRYSVTSQ
jgi:murein L,D-transpeptidase YafK